MTTRRLSDTILKRRCGALFFLFIVLGVVVAFAVVMAGVVLRVNPFTFAAALPVGAVVTAVPINKFRGCGNTFGIDGPKVCADS